MARKPYCQYSIDSESHIVLHNHSLRKYNIAAQVLETMPPEVTILDAGCAEGAIGVALAERFSQAKVTLVNVDDVEAEIVKSLRTDHINVDFYHMRVQDIPHSKCFDVTLWFAIAHHLCGANGPDETLTSICRLTSQRAIVEVPLGADALLAMCIAKHGTDLYVPFTSVETMTHWLSGKFASVQHYGALTYDNSADLNRHVFICEK